MSPLISRKFQQAGDVELVSQPLTLDLVFIKLLIACYVLIL